MDKTIRLAELISVTIVVLIMITVMFFIINEGARILTSKGNTAGPVVRVTIDNSKVATWECDIEDSQIVEVKQLEQKEIIENTIDENGQVQEINSQNIDVRYSILPLKEGNTRVTFHMYSKENPEDVSGAHYVIESQTYNIKVSKVGINSLVANIIQ